MCIRDRSYFRIVDQPENGFFQRIEQFPNGDILVGDAHGTPPIPGIPNGFFLMRLNECGEVLWQKDFRDRTNMIMLSQIAIDEAENIYIFGFYFDTGPGKPIPDILKLSGDGQILTHRRFEGAPGRDFVYSLDYHNGQLYTYGALASLNNPEFCNLMILDTNLNIIQSKKYGPYEAYGEGIALQNGGALMVNGMTVLQVDPNGQLNWARTITGFTNYVSTSIPHEVAGGTIHAVSFGGLTWFFKIDSNGNLLWQSDQFPAHYHLPEMETLPNGDILAIYNDDDTTGFHPVWLRLSSSGEILSQNRLQTTYPINSGFIGVTLYEGERVNLFGNADVDLFAGLLRKDFMLQFNLNAPPPDCFSFEPFSDTQPNTFNLGLQAATITEANAPMVESPLPAVYDSIATSSFNEICPFEPSIEEIRQDTLMECDGEWLIELPGPSFIWSDGYQGQTRIETKAGEWTAIQYECHTKVRHIFHLEKPDCDCLENISNVLTPNGDGINDALIFQSNCNFDFVEIMVFDRWGRSMFTATQLPAAWDGTLGGNPVPEGVYYMAIRGVAASDGGEIKEISEVKNLTLMR